jgi:hypothetical protein
MGIPAFLENRSCIFVAGRGSLRLVLESVGDGFVVLIGDLLPGVLARSGGLGRRGHRRSEFQLQLARVATKHLKAASVHLKVELRAVMGGGSNFLTNDTS